MLIEKLCNLVLRSFKHEEITFHHEFIFVFIPNFVGAYHQKKVNRRGMRKNDISGVEVGGLSIEREANLQHTLPYMNIKRRRRIDAFCNSRFGYYPLI